jgi:hypothetical protein
LKVPKDETDAFSQQETITEATPGETYEIKIGRLFQTLSTQLDGKNLTGPYKSQKHGANFKTRVFHYKGMNTAGPYSHAEAAINGESFNEELPALYGSSWRYWLHYQTNRLKVKLAVAFPFRLIAPFDFERKRRFDRSNYLVKSIKIRITNRGLKINDVELVTMK